MQRTVNELSKLFTDCVVVLKCPITEWSRIMFGAGYKQTSKVMSTLGNPNDSLSNAI